MPRWKSNLVQGSKESVPLALCPKTSWTEQEPAFLRQTPRRSLRLSLGRTACIGDCNKALIWILLPRLAKGRCDRDLDPTIVVALRRKLHRLCPQRKLPRHSNLTTISTANRERKDHPSCSHHGLWPVRLPWCRRRYYQVVHLSSNLLRCNHPSLHALYPLRRCFRIGAWNSTS